ncbi:uncharacterized protein B0H18DRAFT_1001582 [Fomitopsis serialis]|uniref:uncharacterized protein n=1 Tax=Fomitopsis serialis TaxID=139415 RepID=UPI0020073884|nr:uncharacterized protein B0H18DRAFT_1001582 [Neoantrodia serialis]KAH9928174.1 hypothetical protein B0H18DRAFT_1001582 [Neoantrodia serialis]
MCHSALFLAPLNLVHRSVVLLGLAAPKDTRIWSPSRHERNLPLFAPRRAVGTSVGALGTRSFPNNLRPARHT